jgi:hypothetical protein
MALVRDLFGLTVDDEGAIEDAAADTEALSEIRQLPQSRR